ncbi:hemicentin-2-like [Eriocheir sinensis]|uniref:hemicentin-2-like n=1 Tax=Eriocheir sinensis TaxID=95602 RepID=UPI0021C97308|nr:hemicentin-2-like [Eriocheir sinensis]
MASWWVLLLLLCLLALVSHASVPLGVAARRHKSRLTVTPLRRPKATLDPEAAAAAAAALEEQRRAAVRNNSVTDVTGQLGTSAFLPCRTTHSMERQVSWVRRRDWHILTSGTQTYTREERFAVHHPEGSTEWTLAIKYLELDDAGTYECQVSTGAGQASHLVRLAVVSPRAVIPGRGTRHVQVGSTISLTCLIEQSPVPPQFIFWYHDARMINYERQRGGVEVHVEGGPTVTSRLTVSDAQQQDSGNYTCAAANTDAASVFVYVTEEDNKIAAVQPRALGGGPSTLPCPPLLASFLLLLPLASVAAQR